MTDGRRLGGAPVTVAECRQAIKVHEWELLRLVSDLAEQRRLASRHRRGLERGRRICAILWRRCRQRVEGIEMMRDLIRSSPDGLRVSTEGPVQATPAGLSLLARLGRMLEELDPDDDQQLLGFFVQLEALQELAKDLFDYGGVKLVYELGELLHDARQAPAEKLRPLLARVRQLRDQAAHWFE